MGGDGSGVKFWKKAVVENCRTLSMTDLRRGGALQNGYNFTLTWSSQWGRNSTVSLRCDLSNTPCLWLHYGISDVIGGRSDHHYPVALSKDECRFGGVQWYFRCPMAGCAQRVRKLHLPPAGRIFGCRKCHDLTYLSSQEHDNRIKQFIDDPKLIDAAFSGRGGNYDLAARAIFKIHERVNRNRRNG